METQLKRKYPSKEEVHSRLSEIERQDRIMKYDYDNGRISTKKYRDYMMSDTNVFDTY